MIKLTLTQATTHLPFKVAKGSQKTRFRKAQEMNAQLYENMKGAFQYGEIPLGILKSMIQRITGDKIKLTTVPTKSPKSKLSLSLTQKGTISGYDINFSATPTTKKIPFEYAGSILNKTAELFIRILNPKINTREVKFFNEHLPGTYPNIIPEIFSTKPLHKPALCKFLDAFKTTEEKIDALQVLRNHLKIQIKTNKEADKYQQKLNKAFKRYDSKYKDQVHYNQFGLEDKLKQIEETLAEIIKNERAKLAKQ